MSSRSALQVAVYSRLLSHNLESGLGEGKSQNSPASLDFFQAAPSSPSLSHVAGRFQNEHIWSETHAARGQGRGGKKPFALWSGVHQHRRRALSSCTKLTQPLRLLQVLQIQSDSMCVQGSSRCAPGRELTSCLRSSAIAWSPVADFLAVASWNNEVRVFEVGQGGQNQPKALYSHEGESGSF